MKKLFSLCAVMVIVLCLSACGGNVKNVNIVEVESNIYSSEDIKSAIDKIIHEFDKKWNGCTLKEIYYAGDDYLSNFEEHKERYDADEVIVLLSTFDVDSSGGDGSLDPNSTYEDWNWILVRDSGGKWKYVDHGY